MALCRASLLPIACTSFLPLLKPSFFISGVPVSFLFQGWLFPYSASFVKHLLRARHEAKDWDIEMGVELKSSKQHRHLNNQLPYRGENNCLKPPQRGWRLAWVWKAVTFTW